MKRLLLLTAPVVACLCSLPATADVLFSNLGSGNNIYDSTSYWSVYGSGSILGEGGLVYNTFAASFTAVGIGSVAVSQIDLAVTNTPPNLNTFYASIWTDISGIPGSQLTGAHWSLSTNITYGTCCALVSIPGVSGVTLNGGQEYFMVLGPLNSTDSSFVQWNDTTNLSYSGRMISSPDGGATWAVFPGLTDSAFDVLSGPIISTPEPATLPLLGAGLIGILAAWRSQARKAI